MKSIKRYAAPAKGKTADTAGMDLTTVVAGTTLKWLEKANGSTDADKVYLVGAQSQVKGSETAAPFTDHKVYTVVVVPRVAAKTKIASVASAASTGFLAHDVCFNAKTKAACEAKPLKSLAINSASFFLQVATVANVSKDAFTKVKYSQGWKVNGECNDKTKIAKCGT